MKTRKFRKSMLSTVVILMAAILSLTGATYAWFTSGESATVQSITAGVESGSGLLVSSDGATWMDNISINIGHFFNNKFFCKIVISRQNLQLVTCFESVSLFNNYIFTVTIKDRCNKHTYLLWF